MRARRIINAILLFAIFILFLGIAYQFTRQLPKSNIRHYSAKGGEAFLYQAKDEEGKLNINDASMEELLSLPGISEHTARKIIESREEERFSFLEDLMNIKGIGEKTIEKIRPFAYVK